jgi:hypothetical protein
MRPSERPSESSSGPSLSSLKSLSLSSKLPRWRYSHPPSLERAYSTLLRSAVDAGVEVRWFEGNPFDDFGRYLKQKEKEREANTSVGGRE